MTRIRTAAAVSAAALLGISVLPVIITEDQASATCAVGNFLDIIVPEDKLAGTTVASSDEALVTVTQAKEEDGALFNPGGECVAAGEATITVTNPDGSAREIALTITQ